MTANELLASFCHTSSGVTRELALSIAFDAIGLSGRIAIAIGRHLHVEAAPNGTGGIESTGPNPLADWASLTAPFLKLLPGNLLQVLCATGIKTHQPIAEPVQPNVLELRKNPRLDRRPGVNGKSLCSAEPARR